MTKKLIFEKILKELFEIGREQNNQNISLVDTFDDIRNNFPSENVKLLKFFYFNRKKILKILYDEGKNITIDNNMTKDNLSNLLYLLLLIESDKDLVNFEFSLDFINNINDKLKKDKSKYKKILLSTILFKLILNYRNTDTYNKENDEKKLTEIEKDIKNYIKKNINNIREFTTNLNENNLNEIEIEKLYSEIINKLIISDQVVNNDNVIIKELDLDNMNITKTMFDEITKTLDDNNPNIKRYIIKEISDLNDNNKINFYYFLFNHILKAPIYIYHIPFLHRTRNNIIKLIKKNQFNYKDNKNKDIFINVFNFFTDSDYYEKTYLKNSKGKDMPNDTKIAHNNNNESQNINSEYTTRTQNPNRNNIAIDKDYSIMKFKSIIKSLERKEVFIKEMDNGDIIIEGAEDIFNIYDKNMEKNALFDSPINIIVSQDNSATVSRTQVKNSNAYKNARKVKNIVETNKSKSKKKEDFIEILFCSKNVLSLLTLESIFTNKRGKKEQIDFPCSKCFEVKNSRGDIEYIIIGEKGLKHFKHFSRFISYNDPPSCSDERPFTNGIILYNKYLALTSNSILPKGENKLLFYNIRNDPKFIDTEIKHSFNIGINGLLLMKLENNKEILLCACKKYIKDEKNGIAIIDPDPEAIVKKNIYSSFLDTRDFEVSCFCPITKKEKNIILSTNYFLVGGFDSKRRQGMIKLYKVINTSNKSDKFSCVLEFLEDIVIEKNNDFNGFKGTVNCMILTKFKRDLIVSCWDGNVYCFSEPNISDYLEENDSSDSFDS